MADKTGEVTLHGRFPAGTEVELYVSTEGQLRPGDAQRPVGREVVDADNKVTFTGLDPDKRFLAYAFVDGFPRIATLRAGVDDGDAVVQPPVQGRRMRQAGEVDALVPVVAEPVEADEEAVPVDLDGLTVAELRSLAKDRGVDVASDAKKAEIVKAIEAEQDKQAG